MNHKSSMPKKYKDKWIAALRSGEYTQGRGSLYNQEDYSFCCLGVLQHCLTGGVEYNGYNLSPRGTPTLQWLKDWNIDFKTRNGFESDNPPFKLKNNRYRTAIELNDMLNYNFNQIADLIEDQIEGI